MREKSGQRKGILRESSAVALVPALLAPVLGLLIICLVVASCNSTTSPSAPTEPDLVVESLTHSPTSPTTADTMTFVVIVRNIGNATARASVMSLRVGWEADSLWYNVPSLAPNATYQVTYTHQVVYAQNYQNTATADATNVVTESNESNNVATDFFTVTAAGQSGLGTSFLIR